MVNLHTIKKHVLIFLIVLLGKLCFAQKLNLQKFSVKEGLIQSTVKQIQEDKFGNLWLATNNGLSKFNGKDFENFSTTNGLPSNDINSLLFLNDRLYIGTRKGLCFYNGYSIETYPLFNKISGSIKKLLTKNDELHVLTTKGYYLLNINEKDVKIDSVAIPNISSQNPTDAEFDEDGNLWVSTSKKGLFFIETSISTKIPKFVLIQNSVSSSTIKKKLVRIANFNSTNLLKSDAIMNIEFDKQYNLLLSDWGNGFAQIKFDKINNSGFFANYIKINPALTGGIDILRINTIHKDESGDVYFATDGFGFFKVPLDLNTQEVDYTTNSILYIGMSQGFYGNNPLCFKMDSNKNLWIGTLYDGLILLDGGSSMSFNKKHGLEEDKIISLYQSSDSSIWSGTYGGGAFKFKNNQFTRCFWEQKISESIIKTIVEDGNGNILLGTMGGGISIISKENAKKDLLVTKVINENNGLKSKYISYLHKDEEGAIWVGYYTSNSVDKIIINKDLSYSITNFPITNLVTFTANYITSDNDGKVWIASSDGIWILNKQTGLVSNEYVLFKNVQTIAKDWNGNMWIGTSDIGTIILKNKIKIRYFENGNNNQFEKINTSNGISSNCINTILFSKKAAWLVTNNGLNELMIDNYLNQIKDIKAHHKGSGFASYDNKPNAAIIDDNNVIWIGSVEGLTQHQTTKEIDTKKSNKNIKVFINSIYIENKQIDWTNDSLFSSGEYSSISFDGYYNWYKIPKSLALDYSHNSIKFFISTNLIASQKQITYSYKLNGYDKNWTTIYNSNEINYRNLPSGDFSLIIKASLSNDFSTSDEYTYHFSITPPFWKTKTFYGLLIIIVIAALYFFIINREKRLKTEKLKLELIVKSRTAEIEKKKSEIELQNNLIQGINNDLTDSIKYAKRIQQTILPNPQILNKHFADSCIFYKPRNIVSGDYYWIKELDGLIFVAVVDCTGHGVPGAFMSLITSNILNESIDISISQYSPAKMLEYLRKEINVRLSQNSGDQINDGLDISLICYDKDNGTIEYVNANRPLYIISNDELITLASENVNIGGYADFDSVIPSKTISIKQGDCLFMFTDGITDQFGGEKNKKYNPTRLRQFLLMNNHLSMPQLKEKLVKEIAEWQNHYEQTDDILLIGLKI